MSLFKQTQWKTGMGVVLSDLNATSDYLRAQVFDTLRCLARAGEGIAGAGGSAFRHCSEPSGIMAVDLAGAPYLDPDGGGMDIGSLDGVILQAQHAVDGDTPSALAYYLDTNELATTIANGDLDPRIDLVAVKLDVVDGPNVTRNFKDGTSGARTSSTTQPTKVVRLQKQVVTGSPSGTPAEPAVPAGYQRWCSVLVPAGATNLLASNFRDWRFPLGISVAEVKAWDAVCDTAVWLGTAAGTIQRKATTDNAHHVIFVPVGLSRSGGRLLGAQLGAKPGGGGTAPTAKLVDYEVLDPTLGADLVDVTSDLVGASGSYTLGKWAPDFSSDAPLWMDGTGAAYANYRAAVEAGGESALHRLALKWTSGSPSADDTLSLARFIIAGG